MQSYDNEGQDIRQGESPGAFAFYYIMNNPLRALKKGIKETMFRNKYYFKCTVYHTTIWSEWNEK